MKAEHTYSVVGTRANGERIVVSNRTSRDDVPPEPNWRFRVVGIRANGERIVVSGHQSLHVADMVVRLTHNTGDFVKMTIETSDGQTM
jgi:hypothetical protein